MSNEKIMSRVRYYGIRFLQLCGYHTSRSKEYDFVLSNISTHKSVIMDMGSVGSLFPLLLARKGHKVYTVDTREYHEKHPNITSITKDINNIDFPDDYFDGITCVSVLEHIGMAAYGDPIYEDGDKLTINKLHALLKKSGQIFITMPFAGEYKILPWIDTYERIYDFNRISILFDGWKMVKEEYYIPKSAKNWINTSRGNAEKIHNSYPRSNLACFIFEKI